MIWLIGEKGMLGREIAQELKGQQLTFIGSDIEVDITDPVMLREFVGDKSIDWIINASAYTAVDKAESEEGMAFAINGRGVGNIAAIARKLDARVVHFSTDYVFDGEKMDYYQENDKPNPVSAYGRTKLAGEIALQEATDKYFILRISWLYGQYGPNFVSTMLRLFKERDKLGIVDDQKGAPTWTSTLAKNVVSLIQDDLKAYGIYHYSDEGCITWYQFALAIRDLAQQQGLLNNNVQLDPICTADYPTPAKRPVNSVFDKTKVKTSLGFVIVPWRENLRVALREIS